MRSLSWLDPHIQWVKTSGRVNPFLASQLTPAGRSTNPADQTIGASQPIPGESTYPSGSTHTSCGSNHWGGLTHSGWVNPPQRGPTHTSCGSNHSGGSTLSRWVNPVQQVGQPSPVGEPTGEWVKPSGGSTHGPTGSTPWDWVNPRKSGSTRDLRFLKFRPCGREPLVAACGAFEARVGARVVLVVVVGAAVSACSARGGLGG
eukprot:799665-Prymnesium_polylepis.1